MSYSISSMRCNVDGSLLETGYRFLLCITGALIAVLLLRLPLRYAFGSRIAYLIWLLVPIAVIGWVAGSLTPMSTFTPIVLQVEVLGVRLSRSPAPATSVPFGETNWIVVCWMLGVGLFSLIQWWQQYAFVRRLGVLQYTPSGVWVSEIIDIGPVVVGVLPPKIVLPADFYQRYTAQEQIFALAHESMHILRRDPVVNFGVAIVRSLFWFHPLVHLAIRYFRIDQEFACDAAVLDIISQDRHHYARAILKGQISSQTLPAGCRLASQTASSLKRRIIMLQTPAPSFWSRLLGVTVISMSGVVTGGVAWAIQSPPTPTSEQVFQVSVTISKKKSSGGSELLASPTIYTTEAGKVAHILTGTGKEAPVRLANGSVHVGDMVATRMVDSLGRAISIVRLANGSAHVGDVGYSIAMVATRLADSLGRAISMKLTTSKVAAGKRTATTDSVIILREALPARIALDNGLEFDIVVTEVSKGKAPR